MAVGVVHIRKMWMFVYEGGVLVNVGMRFSRWIMRAMSMLVMLVMHVGMGMLHRLMDVFVIVLFGCMKPNT